MSCGCAVEADFLHSLVRASAVREDFLKWALPCFLKLGEVDLLATRAKSVLRRGDAQRSHAHAVDVVNGYAVCQLNDEGTVGWREERVGRNLWDQLNAQLVAQAALEESLGHAAVTWRSNGKCALGLDQGTDQFVCGEQGLVIGEKAALVVGRDNRDEPVTCTLELVGDNLVYLGKAGSKRNQRWWNVQVLKGAGHGVLAADSCKTKVDLCHQCAKKGRCWLAPTVWILTELLEVLLEGKVEVLVLKAGSNQLGNGLNNREVGAAELVGFHEVGVKAPSHARDRVGLAHNRKLSHHRKSRGQLASATEWHKDGTCANGRVKALGKALVRCNV